MKLSEIIEAIQGKRVRISSHANTEAQEDSLVLSEIYLSVVHGKIIETYPTDKPFPSCLICGHTSKKEPVHSVWAYNKKNQWAVLITVYRPDPKRWIDFERRRKKDDPL